MIEHEKPIVESSINKILKYIDDPKCIFEIGAYDGVDIENISNIFKNATIHAFEPDPESFSILKKYESNKVICNDIALSNKTGETKFVKCYNPSLSDQNDRDLWYKTAQSLYHNSDSHHLGRPLNEIEIDVYCDTINNYCDKYNVYPDVLLIDTQGSEYEIFEGATKYLNGVKVILTEWSSRELYIGQKMLSDIESFLSKYNFKLIEKINLWEDFHGDAIFIKI